MERNALGNWSDLKLSISRQISAIIKARFLLKMRNKATIIEILSSFLAILIAFPAYYCTNTIYPTETNPVVEKAQNQTLIDWFLFHGKDAMVVLAPNKPLIHFLIGNTTILNSAISGGLVPNTSATFPGCKVFYLEKLGDLKKEFFKTNKNAVGIEWENLYNDNNDDALKNPKINVYVQSYQSSQNIDFLLELRDSILKMIYQGKNEEDSMSLRTTLYKSNFAHPEVKRESTIYAFAYGVIASFVCIIATIPNMEILFEEKQNRIFAFSILMGMSEVAFWIANFIVSFIICFIGNLIVSLCLSFWFGLKGNDFSMILIFSVLYIIAEIWFQFFLSTFIHNTSNGRWMVVSLIMLGIATSFLFQFIAFQKGSKNVDVVVNMFCLFPFSLYQMFIMQGVFIVSENLPLYNWNNMKNNEYNCQPWYLFTLMTTDIFLYFLLFVIFNLFIPRKYGSPPIDIKKILKNLNRKKRNIELNETHGSDEDDYNDTVISVENLVKKYKGMNDSNALDNVSFSVKNGEVIIVIGPNGAGKSTLINCLSGIIKYNNGNIDFNDNYNPPSIGVCYQDDVLIKSLTIKEHLDLFGAYRGVPKKILNESVNYLNSVLNLSKIKNIRAGNLSCGQKRKLCIALSLLGNPRFLLMDEPTTGVDVAGRLLIWKMISNLKNTTSIVVSHELEEAEFVSSRLFIMNEGKISFSGTSTELKNEYKCGYILRLNIENGNIDPILKLAKEFVLDAEISEDRNDVIRMPDSNRISDFLFALAQKKDELGVKSYTFHVEQFEDVLMSIVYK